MAVSSYTQDASILTVSCNVTATARLNSADLPTQNYTFSNDTNDFNSQMNQSSMEISPEQGYDCCRFNETSNSNDILDCMEHEDQMFQFDNAASHENSAHFHSGTYSSGNTYSDQLGHADHLPYGIHHHQPGYGNFYTGAVISSRLAPTQSVANQVRECTKLLDLNSLSFDDSFNHNFRSTHLQNMNDHYWNDGRRNESDSEDWIESSNTTSSFETHLQTWGGSHDGSTETSPSHQNWHSSDNNQPGDMYDAQLRNSQHHLSPNHQALDRTHCNNDIPHYASSNHRQATTGVKKHPVTDKNKFQCTKIDEPEGPDSGDQDGPVDVDHLISSGVMVAGYKPRNIIRKRSKTNVPKSGKDNWYWEKRKKNNESARRSREMKKEKEKDFYRRALELEYENFFLKERIGYLETQLSCPAQPAADPC